MARFEILDADAAPLGQGPAAGDMLFELGMMYSVGRDVPVDPQTNKPKLDARNADPGKQSRPLIGIPIVLSMKPSATPQKWDGDVYNAEDGKTYSGSFTLTGANTAELKGCVLGGLICKAQTWTRSN